MLAFGAVPKLGNAPRDDSTDDPVRRDRVDARRVKGYWTVDVHGHVTRSATRTSTAARDTLALNQPVLGIAPTATGKGYWLLAARRRHLQLRRRALLRVDRRHALNAPIIGMAATPGGTGYWLLGADGGVFSFGNAAFWGRPAR